MPFNHWKSIWQNLIKLLPLKENQEYSHYRQTLFANQTQTVIQILKELGIVRHPIFLLVGPSGSGKTTWMEKSQYPFLKKIPEENVTKLQESLENRSYLKKHDYCRWWLTEQALFLEIPGDWLFYDDSSFWDFLIPFIQKNSNVFSLTGILLFFSAESFLPLQKKQNHKNQNIIESIFERTKNFINKPLLQYTLITHLDMIKGFQAFFSELKSDERERLLGFTFAENQNQISHLQYDLVQTFEEKFTYLSQKITDQLISRLHQEFILTKRIELAEFPKQFESLYKPLRYLIERLLQKNQFGAHWICLGFYFSSSGVAHQEQDFIHDIQRYFIENNLSNAKPKAAFENTPYFIHEVLNKITSQIKKDKKEKIIYSWKDLIKLQKNQFITYCSATVFFILNSLVIFFIYKNIVLEIDFQQSKLFDLEDKIQLLSPQDINATSKNLPEILKQLQELKNFSYNPLVFLSSNLRHQVNEVEINFLKSILIPQIQKKLELELNSKTLAPGRRFQALDIYLQLANPDLFEKNKIRAWLLQQPEFYNQNINVPNKLIDILYYSCQKGLIKLNTSILQNARNDLINIPPEYLIFELLRSEPGINDITLQSQIYVSGYFTLDGFKNIFLVQLKNISLYVEQYQKVLGLHSKFENENMTLKLTQLYFAKYASEWLKAVRQMLFVSPSKEMSIDYEIQTIKNLQNALEKLTFEAKRNLSPNAFILAAADLFPKKHLLNQAILIGAKNFIGNTFSFLTTSTNSQENKVASQYQIVQISLQSLLQFFQTLTPEKAFQLSSKVFIKDGQNPLAQLKTAVQSHQTLLNSTLMTLYNTGWQVIFDQTARYIDEQWRNQVLPLWQTKIANRYPLLKTAAQEIPLSEFQHFFGSKGVMQSFFDHYLAAFVETSGTRWSLKTYADETLPLNNHLLETFERARIIREMFFPDDQSNFNVKFTLTPQTIQPVIMSVDFNINGQTLINHPGSDNDANFIWPGPYKAEQASIAFYTIDQKTAMDSSQGQWALFKLLDQAMLETTSDPKKFSVTFLIQQMAAKYQLTASKSINPFIPGILEHFDCQSSLLTSKPNLVMLNHSQMIKS